MLWGAPSGDGAAHVRQAEEELVLRRSKRVVLLLQQQPVGKKEEASCGTALRGKSDEEEEQRSNEKGTLGKGPSRSSGPRRRKKSMAGAFGVLAGFALGDLPVTRARVFCFSRPFAMLLLWLPGESGNPVGG